jgi:hypothetical protein
MLNLIVTLPIIPPCSDLAALLSAAEIARFIFFVVLLLFPISLLLGVVGSRRPIW